MDVHVECMCPAHTQPLDKFPLHFPVSGPPPSGDAAWVHLSQREAHQSSKGEDKHRYRIAPYRRNKIEKLSSAWKRRREEEYKRCPQNHKRNGKPAGR